MTKSEKQMHEDFYSHVAPAKQKKKRACLKCKVSLESSHFGHRHCGTCAAQNQRASYLAAIVPI